MRMEQSDMLKSCPHSFKHDLHLQDSLKNNFERRHTVQWENESS